VVGAPRLELAIVGHDGRDLAAPGERNRRVEMDCVEGPHLDGIEPGRAVEHRAIDVEQLVWASTRSAASSKPSRRASRRSSTTRSALDHQAS